MERTSFGAIEDFVELPSKPGHSVAVRLLVPGLSATEQWLVVFVNGLRLSAESWEATIEQFTLLHGVPPVHLLTYDRFGQGRTAAAGPLTLDPLKEPHYTHDITDCAQDLFELVTKLIETRFDGQTLRLVLVAASIGAHIARIFAGRHPELVKGILFLDSNIGHLEYSDLWPDPQDPAFDVQDILEDDCTLDQYIKSTKLLGEMFNSDAKNAEGLDRRNVKDLLPSACQPSLVVDGSAAPWISVVGHDPIAFADQTFEGLDVPRSLSMKFINPEWMRYNKQLLDLTDKAHQCGYSIAQGCGHFIRQYTLPECHATVVLSH